MPTFAFHVYSAVGALAEPVEVILKHHDTVPLARAAAKRLANAKQAPVDLTHQDGRPWDQAYIGTASPLPFQLGAQFSGVE